MKLSLPTTMMIKYLIFCYSFQMQTFLQAEGSLSADLSMLFGRRHENSELHILGNNRRYDNIERRSSDSCESSVKYYKNQTAVLNVRFPHAQVKKDDDYFCTFHKIPLGNKESYITEFIPHAKMSSSHHMLVYGCKAPFRYDKIWPCSYVSSICRGPANIMYAWARNAPAVKLPKHVGFRIGGSTDIRYLVMQMHYAHALPDGQTDCSGFSAHLTQTPQTYQAGIYLLGSPDINIPPHSDYAKADISCVNKAHSPVHVFAFRTHAHALSKVITGYRVRDGKTKMIGKGNPQWPHAFFPRVGGSVDLKKGDVLLARCTYTSDRSVSTYAGMGGGDEMCNFYMMYYTSDHTIPSLDCWGNLVTDLPIEFPPTANELAPYPGYAGQDSIHAIETGTAVRPPIPDEHHHGNHDQEEADHSQASSDDEQSTAKLSNATTHLQPPNVVCDLNWPLNSSDNRVIGQVGGLAVDGSGYIHVFHRGSRVWDASSFNPATNRFRQADKPIREDTMLLLDPLSGAVMHQWGRNMFFMPHGVTVDHTNNIWLTDVAMHQVMRFPQYGASQAQLALGERMVPGDDKHHFCKPAAVAIDEQGYIYVADGYCNRRLVMFSDEGIFLKSLGEKSIKTREGYLPPFNVPHSVALISDGNVCVADRENGRILCFTKDGDLIKVIEHRDVMGDTVYAIAYSGKQGGILYAVNGRPSRNVKTAGFTIDYVTGDIIGRWEPSPEVTLNQPHDVDVSPDGSKVYVGQLAGKKVYAFDVVSANPTNPSQNTDRDTTSQGGANLNSAVVTSDAKDNLDSDDVKNDGGGEETNKSGGRKDVFVNSRDDAAVDDVAVGDNKATSVDDASSMKSSNVDVKEEGQERDSWVIVMVVALVTVPVLCLVIAVFVVRLRKKRYREYQDLLTHDDYGTYKDDGSSFLGKRGFNVGKLLSQHTLEKGFVPLKTHDDSNDDVTDSEDELYSNTMTKQ